MKRIILKRLWLIVLSFLWTFILSWGIITYAQDVDWFNIIPKIEDVWAVNTKIERIWSEGWQVWKHYTDEADQMTPEQQVATWIMNWDTILNYLVFVVKFLSQLWLLVWVMFIMYAWYKYMVSVFVEWKTNGAPSTLKNAIIWVIIVIFSYAIMKTLTSFIWIS
jgi:hypothetical protein